VAELAQLGADSVVVSHGDLPLAHQFERLVVADTVTIVPDRRGDGSNVIVVPAEADFAFAYGRRSFDRHMARAVEAGMPLSVCRDPLLALDVDTPEDLFHPLIQEALPAWLRMNPANPHRNPE
jgi:2-phospho-L-lactate guanylyltransferase (CobY/MobA/RfbA family)